MAVQIKKRKSDREAERWSVLHRAGFRTFIVDPPTMLAFGFAAALFSAKFAAKNPKKILIGACILFQLAFWTLGPLMYFDHPFFASRGLDNDFMWNGYLMGFKVAPASWIPTYHSPALNFLAAIGWLVQPLFLYWGAKLGWNLARKKGWIK